MRFSRSYGPGRYDRNYEERGIAYPIGYVRWTELRNLTAFFELVSENKVQVQPLISSIRPFVEADSVYQELGESNTSVLSIIFDYGVAAGRQQARRESFGLA